MDTYTYEMDQKLTLKLDEKVIEDMRIYAKKRKTSISKLVESYFRYLTSIATMDDDDEVSPLVKSISGIVDASIVAEPRAEYRKHIRKKYSR